MPSSSVLQKLQKLEFSKLLIKESLSDCVCKYVNVNLILYGTYVEDSRLAYHGI